MLWALACGPSGPSGSSGAPGPSRGPDGPAVAFAAGPTVADNPSAGLTRWVDVTLSAPASLRITLENDDRAWSVEGPAATDHHVLVVGLRPQHDHRLRVEALDGEGRVVATDEQWITTGPLPDDFVQTTVTSDPARMEPGATLLGLGGYLAAFDPEGFPIWYVPIPLAIHQVTRLSDGSLVVVLDRTLIVRFDLAGEPLSVWRAAQNPELDGVDAIPVDVLAFHHAVIELPSGDLATLSVERRWIEDYPSSETDPDAPPAPAWVAGDVVVELAPDGGVVRTLSLLDVLDPHHIGYDAVDGAYWEDFGPWRGDDIKDWSHGNSLAYRDGVMAVGLRHQDAVVGLDWDPGQIRWTLGPPTTYHPHGVGFAANGDVTLFDNGNNRAVPFNPPAPDPENESFGLQLDPGGAIGWKWGLGVFSGSLGNVQALPQTGNHLVVYGNVLDPAQPGVQIVEVSPDGDIVWALTADATTFRAERFTGLFPGL